MASQDKGMGPLVGQTVLYNNGGTIVPGIIYAVAAAGTVSICHFGGGSANNVTGIGFDPNLAASKWAYPFVI
jgi:hypothetical protein